MFSLSTLQSISITVHPAVSCASSTQVVAENEEFEYIRMLSEHTHAAHGNMLRQNRRIVTLKPGSMILNDVDSDFEMLSRYDHDHMQRQYIQQIVPKSSSQRSGAIT